MSSRAFHSPQEPSCESAGEDERRNPLAVLRERTRTEHDAIERSLDLTSLTLTRDAYQRTLERFYGFYQPLERDLCEVFGLAQGEAHLAHREKTPWLAGDLLILRSEPQELPLCGDLPALDGMSSALGCMYVLEGASLGGQVISRHLRAHLGITPESGGRFFHAYGEETGAMWKAFGAVVRALVTTPEDQDRAVEAAATTFRTLRRWCERDETQ